MLTFVQGLNSNTSTLSEIYSVYNSTEADSFFGCYAYATQSGFREFELTLGRNFWSSTNSRWLIGIDYGRTDPRALKELEKRENTEVRIFDGIYVLNQIGFLPRCDFHAKLAIMNNSNNNKSGVVIGSGNFSYNGLRQSVEAGSTLIVNSEKKLKNQILPLKKVFEKHWQEATPLSKIISEYSKLRKPKFLPNKKVKKPKKNTSVKKTMFWIEAGYVTQNRGDHRPGNQIFFPKGYRNYFGFKDKVNEQKNSVIGSVTLITAVGNKVENDLRLNANSMEKMSLPKPEENGFGVYDGKVLVFEKKGRSFLLTAFELSEFENIYSKKISEVKTMIGGRCYGSIENNDN